MEEKEQDTVLIDIANKMYNKCIACDHIITLVRRALMDVRYDREVIYDDMCEAKTCAAKLKEKVEDIIRMSDEYITKQGQIFLERIKAKILAEIGEEEENAGGEEQDELLLN